MTLPEPVKAAAMRLWIRALSTDPEADEGLLRAWADARWPDGIPIKRDTLVLWVMSQAAADRLAA